MRYHRCYHGTGDECGRSRSSPCSFRFRYNDGRKVPKRVIDQILDELFEFAGGVTLAHATKGLYRMTDGSKKEDECACVWIGVTRKRVPGLRRIVARIGCVLGQESMYLEHPSGTIEFILPEDEAPK